MAYGSHPSALRVQKVRKIFDKFDVNKDEHLNREEMSALVVAANPKVSFNDDQIAAILEEVFRTYGDYIDGDKGLSFEGLLQTYDDGAGDIDRDFKALNLELDSDARVLDKVPGKGFVSGLHNSRSGGLGSWIGSPRNGIMYDDTWGLIEELELLIKQLESKMEKSKGTKKRSSCMILRSMGLGWISQFDRSPWEEIGHDYLQFQEELNDLIGKADRSCTQDEAFDAHMAMGRTLFDHRLYEAAVRNFKRAGELKPMDARPHFQQGNTLYALGKAAEAKEAYSLALSSAEMNVEQWSNLLPQIHVNLGIALEAEGMLLCACEHYKEAAIMEPKHYRALKLLGSALYGVGEYQSAKDALLEAILLHSDYADAHCELGSVHHALGDHDSAVMEFQKALEIRTDHIEALFNHATLLKDTGHYRRAAEIYSKVLKLEPGNWRAQINKAVCLLGIGDINESKRAFRVAYRMTRRIELYDAMLHLRQMQRRHKGLRIYRPDDRVQTGNDFIIVEPSCFKRVNSNTTPRELLAFALDIQEFQRCTRFNECNIADLRKELNQTLLPVSTSHVGISEKFTRKEALEKIMRRLLHSLKPEAFQCAMKVINERMLAVLDPTGSGKVDVGMVFAILALTCRGPLDKRKHTAFDALIFRSSRNIDGEISRQDGKQFLKSLQAVFNQQSQDINVVDIIMEDQSLTFPEFVEMLEDPNQGFGVLSVLVKLEVGSHVWRGYACSVCSYPVYGLLFKEAKANFSLCSLCYSSGKVPSTTEHGIFYFFKEYNSEMEAFKDRLNFTCLEL